MGILIKKCSYELKVELLPYHFSFVQALPNHDVFSLHLHEHHNLQDSHTYCCSNLQDSHMNAFKDKFHLTVVLNL